MQRTPPSAAVARTSESKFVFCSPLNFLPLAVYFCAPPVVRTMAAYYLVPGKIFRRSEKVFNQPRNFQVTRRNGAKGAVLML
jgi:hypothetical protein